MLALWKLGFKCALVNFGGKRTRDIRLFRELKGVSSSSSLGSIVMVVNRFDSCAAWAVAKQPCRFLKPAEKFVGQTLLMVPSSQSISPSAYMSCSMLIWGFAKSTVSSWSQDFTTILEGCWGWRPCVCRLLLQDSGCILMSCWRFEQGFASQLLLRPL